MADSCAESSTCTGRFVRGRRTRWPSASSRTPLQAASKRSPSPGRTSTEARAERTTPRITPLAAATESPPCEDRTSASGAMSNPKRYRNLFGITLGTGLGGGIGRDGELFLGDNSAGGEAWLLLNRLDPAVNAEEGASIRAVRRAYAMACGIPHDNAPDPRTIAEIAAGAAPGNRVAAIEAFRRLGVVAGDVLAQALTLIDGLAVIGGGIAGAYPLFLPRSE